MLAKIGIRPVIDGRQFGIRESLEEQTMIPSVTHSINDDVNYSTTDQVFLLNATEANRYFNTDDDRICTLTAYAEAQGALNFWWLRSNNSRCAYLRDYVSYDGSIGRHESVDSNDTAVRPVLWIDLGSLDIR